MSLSFHDLPRDVILKIISKLDIDTRIKVGLILKLKVPSRVVQEISRCLQVPSTLPGLDDYWCIKLGPYVFPDDNEYRLYHLQHFYAYGTIVYLTTHAILGKGTINFSTHDVEGEFDEFDEIV
jgi:hypothetical protein